MFFANRCYNRAQKQGPSVEDVTRFEELQSNIATLTRNIEKLETHTSQISNDIQRLQDQILEIGGVRLRSQNAKVDGINEMIAGNSNKMTKLQVERTTRDKAVKKLLKSIEKNTNDLEATVSEMEHIKMELEKQRAAADMVISKVSEAEKVSINIRFSAG